jgi:hypothetical protein
MEPQSYDKTGSQAYMEALYLWSKAQFGQPIQFYRYDKNMLTDFNWIVKQVGKEFPELGTSRDEIKIYEDHGLLPTCYEKDGTKGYPVYTVERIDFITDLIKTWGYSLSQIKAFTDYEEAIIDDILTADKLDYSDLPPLEFLIEWLRRDIRMEKSQHKYAEKLSERLRIEKEIKKIKKALKFYRSRKFDGFSKDTQIEIEQMVFRIKWHFEYLRTMFIFEDRAKALLGFSPHANIRKFALSLIDSDIFDDDYAYMYNYKDLRKFYYGDWDDSDVYITEEYPFFATPEFLIEYRDIDQFSITIRDVAKVDARYMRRITKVYTKLREPVRPKKAGWGEKSGKKQLIEKRNRLLRDTYAELRGKKPSVAAEKLMTMAIQQVLPDEDISLERAKRIIYGKGDDMS